MAKKNKKIAALGLEFPLFPTMTVGSLPKPPDIAEMRNKVAQGFVQRSELERKEKIAIEGWLREQEKLGLSVLVDGELRRSDLVSYFAERIEGYERGGLVRIYGNRYYRKPVVKQKLAWKGSMSVESWQFAQRATHRPVKAIVTGAYTMMDWSFNEFYTSRESLLADLTTIMTHEVRALAEAGAKIIQIDEPALPLNTTEFSLMSKSIQTMTAGLKPYFIFHTCYADLSTLWPKLSKLTVDNFSLEGANSDYALLRFLKKNPTDKDLSIGVIDSHSHVVETPRMVTDRIKKILKAVPASQLWITTDCGLKTRTMDEATGKLDAINKSISAFRKPR